MPMTDSSCPTATTFPSRRSSTETAPGAPTCMRRPSRVPRRRSTPTVTAVTAGELAREAYARDAIDARTTGLWL